MLWLRRVAVLSIAVAMIAAGRIQALVFGVWLGPQIATIIQINALIWGVVFGIVGWWWVSVLWQKSIAIVTTMRLVKLIYTTPFNRHNLALPLDMIVDTGAYSKGFWQAIFKLGTFTARSSAASSGAATDDPERVNKKYFFIENISQSEDLHHYISKLLYAFRQRHDQLETFRPFLPHLKGDARKKFMEQYPDYWS